MTKFLIIGLSILILLLLAWNISKSLSDQKRGKPSLPVQVAPSYSPTATFNPFVKMPLPTPADLKPLQVVEVEPKEDLSKEYNPVTEVKFTFSDSIDLDDFPLEISPDTKVGVIPDTTTHTYTISPKTFWPNGVTTFTIKQDAKSLKGATLDSTFIYKINFQDPKNPPDDESL